MLDEKALRKPEFEQGCVIKLADGQEWSFPTPRFRIVPRLGDDGSVGLASRSNFGREFDDCVEILSGAKEVDDMEWFTSRFRGAIRLLTANYTLTSDDLELLIPYESSNESSLEMWGEIDRVMQGIVPKP